MPVEGHSLEIRKAFLRLQDQEMRERKKNRGEGGRERGLVRGGIRRVRSIFPELNGPSNSTNIY